MADESSRKASNNYRRRIFIVQSMLQVKYVLLTIGLVILSCFTVWWETYRSMMYMAGEGLLKDPSLANALTQINHFVFLKVVFLLILIAIFSFLISHYVAGPIFRFEKGLKALREGDFDQRIHLRKRDELKNIGDAFNSTLDSLEKRNRKRKEKLSEIVEELEKLSDKGGKDVGGRLSGIAQEINRLI